MGRTAATANAVDEGVACIKEVVMLDRPTVLDANATERTEACALAMMNESTVCVLLTGSENGMGVTIAGEAEALTGTVVVIIAASEGVVLKEAVTFRATADTPATTPATSGFAGAGLFWKKLPNKEEAVELESAVTGFTRGEASVDEPILTAGTIGDALLGAPDDAATTDEGGEPTPISLGSGVSMGAFEILSVGAGSKGVGSAGATSSGAFADEGAFAAREGLSAGFRAGKSAGFGAGSSSNVGAGTSGGLGGETSFVGVGPILTTALPVFFTTAFEGTPGTGVSADSGVEWLVGAVETMDERSEQAKKNIPMILDVAEDGVTLVVEETSGAKGESLTGPSASVAVATVVAKEAAAPARAIAGAATRTVVVTVGVS